MYITIVYRLVLSESYVSLYVVHLGGLTLDLTLGFMLLLPPTRPLAFTLAASFHLMNSQLFSIGRYPTPRLHPVRPQTL